MVDAPSPSLPLLLIVLGPPAAGKTTLARRLAANLTLPLMTKDMIKELLLTILGYDDIAQSRRLGHASIMLLLQFAEVQVAARRSCLIECNLRAQWNNAHLQELQQRHPFYPVQVLCRADDAVLFERYRRRATSGERHPGHLDNARCAEWDAEQVRAQCEPLAIGGEVIEVDTTDFAAVDYPGLLARVRALQSRLS